MMLLGLGLGVLAGSGALALLVAPLRGRSPGRELAALLVALLGLVTGALLAGVPAWEALRGAPLWFHAPWALPGASLALELDRLAGFFVLTVLLTSVLAGVYGVGYLRALGGRKALGPPLLLFNLLVAAMCLVVAASNVVLFLVAWELMTVLACLLVTFEDEDPEVRRAGLTYLVMCHLGTLVLVAFFLLLGRPSGSLDFAAIAAGPRAGPAEATALFALALVGFGAKIGLWPLHTWLPLAHPAAPSHVSALMSGVIVKVAVYGLVRGLTLIGPPRAAWGVVLIAVGVSSGVLGVLYALAQHDLKRLLAYHTIENLGIIFLGLGLGTLGVAREAPWIAVVGFAGGLLHVLNHALFKGLLFFGAGAVAQATGARDIERQGGLARRMPWTAATFLVGSAAICGLPPLNGFLSEWLVYLAAARALQAPSMTDGLTAALVIASLALIGGLAAACFAKAFGVVFLGHPRAPAAGAAVECGAWMRAAMLLAAAACVTIGLLPGPVGALLLPVAAAVAGDLGLPAAAALPVQGTTEGLAAIGRTGALLVTLAVALGLGLRLLARGAAPARVPTWGCGYGAPGPRMQYTGSSFADPLLRMARSVLRPHIRNEPPEGPFPGPAARETHTGDRVHTSVYLGLVRGASAALRALRPLQQGRVQLYLLYVLAAVVLLLIYELTTA